ncbi:MAG TPA: MoaD/ThiS family protein [Gemmatimonadota bacterium]
MREHATIDGKDGDRGGDVSHAASTATGGAAARAALASQSGNPTTGSTPAVATEPARVLLFGRVRELAGTGQTTIPVRPGATVATIAGLLADANPGLAPHLQRCSFAVNASYAPRSAVVHPGDEVAVIPPIGGG